VPKKANLKETLEIAVSSATVAAPLTVIYRLLSAAEVVKLEKEAADKKSESDAKTAEMNRPLDDKDVRRLLQELKQPDKRRAAADRLAKGPANDMREQVAKALGAMLKDPDNWTRKTAVVSLGMWGTADNVPALIPLLEDGDVFLKSEVMKTLGKLANERGAEAVAKHFFADRHNAAEAIKAMGPMTEPHVVPLLEDREEGIRVEASKVLAAIGTDKSRPALEALSKKGNGFAAREAEQALRQIASRQ
jgi:HEAT repeat protein